MEKARYDFEGSLAMGMTAHPKKDPATGEIFAFPYAPAPVPPFLMTYFHFDTAGNKIFSVRQPSFIHDFAITRTKACAMPAHLSGIPLGPRFVSPSAAGLDNLKQHLLNFHTTSQVQEGLSQHVTVSKKTKVSDFSSWPDGVQFELNTLPVKSKLVGDGDGMIVHVDVADPKESDAVPLEILEAAIERREARAVRDYARADALHAIIINAGYRVVTGDILAREYRIRLRGIDAPEMSQDFGQEAKDRLRQLIQGKPLKILVYCQDPYGRFVGDVYCEGNFIQEELLRGGFAWHYNHFDKRPIFAQMEAKSARRGLWANPSPIEPWEHKKRERKENFGQTPHQYRRSFASNNGTEIVYHEMVQVRLRARF